MAQKGLTLGLLGEEYDANKGEESEEEEEEEGEGGGEENKEEEEQDKELEEKDQQQVVLLDCYSACQCYIKTSINSSLC